jgi:hypothetical protein
MRPILAPLELEGGLKPTAVLVDETTSKLLVPDGLLLRLMLL